ncbi:triose-phosphate isomerase [Candidatus Microgenomates bacterium]|nr:triose-phosphate isomerase [Candidatus Microgenomates bacterium]
MIFVNFKTYKEATGARAVDLVRTLLECETEASIPIVPVVQVVDARECVKVSKSTVWVQHIDGVKYGQFTGWTLPEAVAETGIKGTFLNHSENKKDMADLTAIVSRCSEVGLKTLIFAGDTDELTQVVSLAPSYVSYEPPELIASKDTSVARAKPEIIADAAKIAKTAGVPLIVGAGVKDSGDVRRSLELGAVGVAVSSAVVLAANPKDVVLGLAKGFSKN